MSGLELSAGDRLDILQLGSIYAWGIDHHDSDVFALVFTDDPVVRYGPDTVLRGHEQFRRYVHEFHAMHDSTQHFIANHWILPQEDHVLCRSYVILTMALKDYPGGGIFQAGAYYIDRVVQTQAGWRIAERDAHGFWMNGNQTLSHLGQQAVKHLL
jgi:hypothetical protein